MLNVLVGIPLAPSAFPLVRWRAIAPLAGVVLLVGLDALPMRRLIAVIVIALDWRYPGTPHPLANVGIGGLAGFLGGATGIGGPPVILHVLAGPGTAAEKRADIIWIYVPFNSVTALSLWVGGGLDAPSAGRGLAAAPIYLSAAWLGMKFFGGSTDKPYYRVALAALVA